MLIFTVLIVWWPLKLSQGHQNLNKSLYRPNVAIYEVATICHLIQEIGCGQVFWGVKIWKFYIFYSVMTLKIRSRSPKPNQIFKPFQCYNIWSLARIRHLVQEIGCRQAFLVKIWNFQSAAVTSLPIMCLCKFGQNPPISSGDNQQRGRRRQRRRDPHQKQFAPPPLSVGGT